MIKEAYVSFEVAKLLKKKGFKELTQYVWYEKLPKETACHDSEIGKPKLELYYLDNKTEFNSYFGNADDIPKYIEGNIYSAPTHQMALAWLREKHKHIIIDYREVSYKWYFRIPYCYNSFSDNFDLFDTYEEATEEAVKFTLKHLLA